MPARDDFEPVTPEYHMTEEELSAVRGRMVREAVRMERDAADKIESVAAAMRDGHIPQRGEEEDAPEPLREVLEPIFKQWALAQDIKLSAAQLA